MIDRTFPNPDHARDQLSASDGTSDSSVIADGETAQSSEPRDAAMQPALMVATL